MAVKLAHRGPDDSGIWIDRSVGIALAHSRLSILDLSPAGHQPMVSASGRLSIVLNGEIYNHSTLRACLDTDFALTPPVWRGHSDTETLLAAIEAWGLEITLKRAVGMFAFVLWDREKRSLSLVRDRMGEKPLYYGWQGNSFVFASELKALKAYPAFRPELNRDGVAQYLQHGYIPAPASIYRGIYKLRPGTYLELSFEQGEESARRATPRHYWSLSTVVAAGQRTPFDGTPSEAVAELESRISEAVRLQMIADVPLGAFLSGGVDSSTIAALMQAASSRPVKTFTIGFHEDQYDEARHAKEVARHLGTDHTEAFLSPAEGMACIPKLPSLYDEPFADSSQIPTFLVSQLARQSVTVSLSGDAGDELFGGYNHYALASNIWNKMKWIPTAARGVIADGIGLPSSEVWRNIQTLLSKLVRLEPNYLLGDKARKLAEILDRRDPISVYRALLAHWNKPSELITQSLTGDNQVEQAIVPDVLRDLEHQMMYFDAVTYLPDDILVKVDRAAMGVSLETRMPMLDHRVVEFAWRLPLSMKIRKGATKWALRELLFKYVPPQLIERPKRGFGVPIGEWLRGPLRPWAESLVASGKIERQGILNAPLIQKAWQEHVSGERNWERRLWTILMFQAWVEEHWENSPAA